MQSFFEWNVGCTFGPEGPRRLGNRFIGGNGWLRGIFSATLGFIGALAVG